MVVRFKVFSVASVPLWFTRVLFEDDGFAAGDEDAIFEDEVEGAGEDDFFDFAAFLCHGFGCVGVRHRQDTLGDDGAVIKNFRHEMGGCTDDFDAAIVSLAVRLRADEGGQE